MYFKFQSSFSKSKVVGKKKPDFKQEPVKTKPEHLRGVSPSNARRSSSSRLVRTQCLQALTPYAYLKGKLHSELSELSS